MTSTYSHPKKLQEQAKTVSHDEMNDKLGTLRNVRWDKKNMLAVKRDYLERVQKKGIKTAVCLASVSPVLVAKTFNDFGVTALLGHVFETKEFNASLKALDASEKPNSIALSNSDVLDHLDIYKKNVFVEADFRGFITMQNKFFKNLPEYWSLNVCSTRYGSVVKLLKMFSKNIGGKIELGKTTECKTKDGAIYEHTDLTIKNKIFHMYMYKYRDPKPENKKPRTMIVFTNI